MKMVIVMRTDLNMRKGKMCAQAAHAAVMSAMGHINASTPEHKKNITKWLDEGQKKIVVGVGSLDELYNIRNKAVLTEKLYIQTVTDAGHTEFHGAPTVTCLCLGPSSDEILDPITGELKLL
jgi:peptidyl-tRNA hydrolase, PTH2 family